MGTIISFRVSCYNAKYLAEEFHPIFDQTDPINLPNYHIYLKMMIDGVTSKPFSATTLLSPDEKTPYRDKIIEASRVKYGRPRKEAERIIHLRKQETKVTEKKTRQGSLFS